MTADMVPIGTPIPIIMTSVIYPPNPGHPYLGAFSFMPAEDVVVNGRLVVAKGSHPLDEFPSTVVLPAAAWGWGVWKRLGLEGPCSSISVAASFLWTEDYQALPVSFGDPRSGMANSLLLPLQQEGPHCRRSNVEGTVYVIGAPIVVTADWLKEHFLKQQPNR